MVESLIKKIFKITKYGWRSPGCCPSSNIYENAVELEEIEQLHVESNDRVPH